MAAEFVVGGLAAVLIAAIGVHTGVVGNYAAWTVAGAAVFAVVWGVTLR